MRTRALVGTVAVIAVAALAVASFAVTRDHRPAKPAVTKEQLVAWEDAVLPVLQDGGKTVEQGMKAAVDDLVNRHVVPAYVIAREADGWATALRDVKTRLATVATPPVLAPAVRDFQSALDEYVLAAGEFHKAALAPAGPERDRLVASGRSHGEAADDVYDRGGALVQSLRHDLGMPANVFFPEPLDD
jgi:hypothetical protein